MDGKFVLNRVIQTALTILSVLTILWLMFRAIPGDPASIYISGRLSPEDIEALRKSFGLDLPLYLQYLKYMSNFFTGDFGMSF